MQTSQNQKLLFIRSKRNHKIISSTKNFQGQIWRSDHAIKVYQLWSSTRQRAGTGALFAIRRSSTCLGYHNCNLCGQHSYPGGSQKPYRGILAFTRKSFLLPEIAKEMENQSQRGKICAGDIYHPQRDVPTTKRLENPST